MSRVWALARKDLVQVVRDKKIAFVLVVMPLVFTAAFGTAFERADEAVVPRVLVLADEASREVAAGFLRLLEDPGGLDVEILAPSARESAIDEVKRKQAQAVVVLAPASASALRRAERPSLEVIADQGDTEASLALRRIEATVFRAIVAARAAPAGPLDDAVAAWQGRAAVQRLAFGVDGDKLVPSGMRQASPGILIQFAIMSLIGSAGILFAERKQGMLARLLAGSMSRSAIIAGHGLAMFALAFGQMLILVVGGQVLFGVEYARAPLGIVIVLVAFGLFLAALALCIGAFAKKEDHVVLLSLAAMFALSGLGGAWVPLDVMGDTLKTVGHLLPSAWALDGLQNIVVRGQGAASTLRPAGVVLLWAVGFGALAVWRLGRNTATRA